jgi:hypothetical protein
VANENFYHGAPVVNIAEQCKESDDAFKAAAECAVYKKELSDFRVVFYFADGSYLAFTVSYVAAEAGESFP